MNDDIGMWLEELHEWVDDYDAHDFPVNVLKQKIRMKMLEISE